MRPFEVTNWFSVLAPPGLGVCSSRAAGDGQVVQGHRGRDRSPSRLSLGVVRPRTSRDRSLAAAHVAHSGSLSNAFP